MSYYKQNNFEEYFWNRFDKSGSCWLWKGRVKQPHNYGTIQKDHKTLYIHRVAYILSFGEIPDSLVIRHKCHVRHCGNPAHLEVGTQAENIQDSVKDTRLPMGENHYRTKLKESEVITIRKEYWFNNTTARILASKYNVSVGCVESIVAGYTWKHLPNFKQSS